MSHPDAALLREIIELEHSIADAWDDLDLLKELKERCGSATRPAACRKAIQKRIDHKIARIARLQKRRDDIRRQLGE